MKRLLSLLLIGCSAVFAQAGFTKLFDGKSLSGWTPEGNAKWTVSRGALLSDQSGDGWLRTNKMYTDFIFKVEFRNSPKGNSGVFFRATQKSKPGEPNPLDGYELQIHNEDEKWATGSIEDVIQRLVLVNPTPNQWHSYELQAHGDHFVAKLDGTKVLDGRDSKLKSGFIGLQHHKNMKVEFRNIQIEELGAKR